jgi:hypothetical protein
MKFSKQIFQMKLPIHFKNLSRQEKQEWQEVKNCMDYIETHFDLIPCSTLDLKKFYLFSSKVNPSLLKAYIIKNDGQKSIYA